MVSRNLTKTQTPALTGPTAANNAPVPASAVALRYAWLPVPLLLTGIIVGRLLGLRGSCECPALTLVLSFTFYTLVSLGTLYLIGRRFIVPPCRCRSRAVAPARVPGEIPLPGSRLRLHPGRTLVHPAGGARSLVPGLLHPGPRRYAGALLRAQRGHHAGRKFRHVRCGRNE